MAIKTSKVIKSFGQWAVTTYGVECVETYYPIEKARLWQGEPGHPWEKHMAVKRWINYPDFIEAMAFAREHHAKAHAK